MAQEKPIWSEDGLTLSNVLINDIPKTYNVVTTWWDGTPMDDTKLDEDLVYVKYEGKYLRVNEELGQILQKDNMNEMRLLSEKEILFLRLGIYKHIQLNGYYFKGDTPSSIDYYISNTIKEDDGGSIISTTSIKVEHIFNSNIDPRYFGCILDGITDNNIRFKKLLTYAKNKGRVLIKEGLLFIDIGSNPEKTIFIDDNTLIETQGDAAIVVNNLFVPSFVAALSKNWSFKCKVIYRAQYDSSKYGFVNGVNGETFGDLFDRTIYKQYLENNRGIIFTGSYGPRKLTYASYLSILLIRGATDYDIDHLNTLHL